MQNSLLFNDHMPPFMELIQKIELIIYNIFHCILIEKLHTLLLRDKLNDNPLNTLYLHYESPLIIFQIKKNLPFTMEFSPNYYPSVSKHTILLS